MSRGKGFTLLELIVVVIIIGVLATLGFTQYTRVVERGRSSEAKMILGQIRTAQEAYKLEYDSYAGDIANVSVEAPSNCTQVTHYFSYAGDGTLATATRCSTGGKTPSSTIAYTISLTYSTGVFSGSAGYY